MQIYGIGDSNDMPHQVCNVSVRLPSHSIHLVLNVAGGQDCAVSVHAISQLTLQPTLLRNLPPTGIIRVGTATKQVSVPDVIRTAQQLVHKY